jgi:hypothetical protein
MLLVVNPLTFESSAIRRSQVNTITVTYVLIPVSLIAGTISPIASPNTYTHSILIYLASIGASILLNGKVTLPVAVVRRIGVSVAHLDLILICELHLLHESLLLRGSHHDYGLVLHHINRLISLEHIHVLTNSDTNCFPIIFSSQIIIFLFFIKVMIRPFSRD